MHTSTIYVFVTLLSLPVTEAYRHSIFEKPQPLCNNRTCYGNPHTACMTDYSRNCRKFRYISVTEHDKKILCLGHNGIRNKVAKDWGIANMNLLHWSRDLEKLSKLYLRRCMPLRDPCDFLVQDNITIGNSIYFSKDPLLRRWAGRVLRAWYFEIGFDTYNVQDFMEDWDESPDNPNFAQMIWPTAEFLGCSAAKMSSGHMVVCYYHPRMAREGWDDFQLGKGCSRCPDERPTCSRDFRSICGIDDVFALSPGLHKLSTGVMFVLLFRAGSVILC